MPKSAKKTGVRKKAKGPLVKCVWAIVCRSASVDQLTNNFSLFSILEEIGLPAEVFGKQNRVFLEHEIVALWRRSIPVGLDDNALEADILLELIDPNGVSLLKVLNKLSMPADKERMRTRLIFNAIPNLTTIGTYVYRLQHKRIDEEEFGDSFEIPIRVNSTTR